MKRFKVYVIDDDADVRRSICFLLNSDGHEAQAFKSGQAFLSSMDQLSAACVLLDVRMPVMDGLQLLAEIVKRGCDWPVIIMTGHGEEDIAARALKLGAVDFLEKPFEEDLLISCLAHASNRLETEQQ